MSISAGFYQAGIRLDCWKGEFVTSTVTSLDAEYPLDAPTETAQNLRWSVYIKQYDAADAGYDPNKVEYGAPTISWPVIWPHGNILQGTYVVDNVYPGTAKQTIDVRTDGSYISGGALPIAATSIEYAGAGAAPSPAQTGIVSYYSSTSSTATSGNAWNYKYQVGTPAYYFVELAPGYMPKFLSDWVNVGGRCYRVASYASMPSGGVTITVENPLREILLIYLRSTSGSGLTWKRIDVTPATEVESVSVYYGWYGTVTSFSDDCEVEIYDENGTLQYRLYAFQNVGYQFTAFDHLTNLDYSTPNFYVREGIAGYIYASNSALPCQVTVTAGSTIYSVYMSGSDGNTYNSGAYVPNGVTLTVMAYFNATANPHYEPPSG